MSGANSDEKYQAQIYISKASASVLAVDERQSLETIRRDEKIASRALEQLKHGKDTLEEKKERISGDAAVQTRKEREVQTISSQHTIFDVLFGLLLSSSKILC